MELHWAVEALQDRDAIYDYIQADSPQAALTLDELFAKQAGRLVDYPHLGRVGRVEGTRELLAHRNYILVYELAGEQIRILRVLHAARRWPPQ